MISNSVLRAILKQYISVNYRIKTVARDKELMKKELFVSVLKTLKEIEDRREFLGSELGMDLSEYESKYFEVIENLLRMSFNKHQIFLIELYMYDLPIDQDWDGTITVTVGKNEEKVAFKTPEDVWQAMQRFN